MNALDVLGLGKTFVDVASEGPPAAAKALATLALGPVGVAVDVADTIAKLNGTELGVEVAKLLVDPETGERVGSPPASRENFSAPCSYSAPPQGLYEYGNF